MLKTPDRLVRRGARALVSAASGMLAVMFLGGLRCGPMDPPVDLEPDASALDAGPTVSDAGPSLSDAAVLPDAGSADATP
jgi:hypothetical protein